MILVAGLLGACQSVASDPGVDGPRPDITDPGPDFGYIPNSAQVVPPGRAYLETGAQTTQEADRTVRTTFWPTLLRVGVATGLELRAQMNLVSHVQRPANDPAGNSTGHGPLQLGFKYRFNDGDQGFWNPSWGTEWEFLLPTGSAGFDSGKVQPTLTVNVDHFLNENWTFTWNLGGAGPVDGNGEQYVQGYAAAALNGWVTDSLQYYVTGEYRAPTVRDGGGSVGRVGTGIYYYFSKRVSMVAGYNHGLTVDSLDTDFVLGLGFSF